MLWVSELTVARWPPCADVLDSAVRHVFNIYALHHSSTRIDRSVCHTLSVPWIWGAACRWFRRESMTEVRPLLAEDESERTELSVVLEYTAQPNHWGGSTFFQCITIDWELCHNISASFSWMCSRTPSSFIRIWPLQRCSIKHLHDAGNLSLHCC